MTIPTVSIRSVLGIILLVLAIVFGVLGTLPVLIAVLFGIAGVALLF